MVILVHKVKYSLHKSHRQDFKQRAEHLWKDFLHLYRITRGLMDVTLWLKQCHSAPKNVESTSSIVLVDRG
jgi:hypothetical protein